MLRSEPVVDTAEGLLRRSTALILRVGLGDRDEYPSNCVCRFELLSLGVRLLIVTRLESLLRRLEAGEKERDLERPLEE